MYKIQDVRLKKSLLERIFGISTVICFTGDTTHPKLYIHNIKNSKETKDFILKYSEEARLKRRTLNTLNIGAHDAEDIEADC